MYLKRKTNTYKLHFKYFICLVVKKGVATITIVYSFKKYKKKIEKAYT